MYIIFDYKIITFRVNNYFQKVLSIFTFLIINRLDFDSMSSTNWYISSAVSNYLCQIFILVKIIKNCDTQCIKIYIGYNIVGFASKTFDI